MTKKEAQGYLVAFNLMATNHLKTCSCGKTPKGAATEHCGKTEEQYEEILATAAAP